MDLGLNAFLTLERGLTRWRGRRGPPDDGLSLEQRYTNLLAGLPYDAPPYAELKARYKYFHQRAVRRAEIEAFEESKRHESAAIVSQAMDIKNAEFNVSRALVRFSGKLRVQLIHHRAGGKTMQRLAVLDGRISWKNFLPWLAVYIGPTSKIVVEYHRATGSAERLNNQKSLDEWLSRMWCSHPLTLYLYDCEHMIEESLRHTDRLHELFDRLDTNHDGVLSSSEVETTVADFTSSLVLALALALTRSRPGSLSPSLTLTLSLCPRARRWRPPSPTLASRISWRV